VRRVGACPGGLLTGSAFDTKVGGTRIALSYAGAILTLAFSTTSAGADVQSPFGSYPGYVSLMERDFNRASEDAGLAGLAYDGRLGLRAPWPHRWPLGLSRGPCVPVARVRPNFAMHIRARRR
jgi:hypothetical protein